MYDPTNFTISEVGTPHYPIPSMVNVVSEIHPSPLTPMSFRGVYTYSYMPLLVVLSPLVAQVKVNLAMLFTQSLPIQTSDELKEQEQKKV